MQKTFVWLDSFELIHNFKNQTIEDDYVVLHGKQLFMGKVW